MLHKSFEEYLTEAGTDPLPITWTKDGLVWSGEFFVDVQKFTIKAKVFDIINGTSVIDFKFYRDGQTKLFNDHKYPFSVYPTIRGALEEYVKEMKPEALLFASADESRSRRAMYRLEGGRLATKYDYHDVSDIPELTEIDAPIFGIYKEESFRKDIFELIGI